MRVKEKIIMYNRKPGRYCVCVGSLSMILILLGIIVITTRTMIYNYLFSLLVTMKPGSITYTIWKENFLPLQLKIYVFNWTNPHEIYNKSSKPSFEEVGPLTYSETKQKVNVTWHQNDTVSFYIHKKWVFQRSESVTSLDVPVNILAPVALSAATKMKDWAYVFKTSLNILLASLSAKIYQTQSVGDVLFGGFKDTVLDMGNKFPARLLNQGMPHFDKFGWFYTRNDSMLFDGHFNIGTGKTKQLGEIYTWRYMNQTDFYPEHCGAIRGSAGDFFPTHLKKTTIIPYFSPDMCRYVELEFDREVYVNDVLGYKFTASNRFLDDGGKVAENQCFNGTREMAPGVIDIATCRYGSPGYVSLPHFYKADSVYTDSVSGLEPRDELHNFYMIFEPNTGLPLEVAARLQLNLYVQKMPGITIYENAPNILMPILWFEQTLTATKPLSFLVATFINLPSILLTFGFVLILFGFFTEMCCCYQLCTTKMFQRKHPVITREHVPLTSNLNEYKIRS